MVGGAVGGAVSGAAEVPTSAKARVLFQGSCGMGARWPVCWGRRIAQSVRLEWCGWRVQVGMRLGVRLGMRSRLLQKCCAASVAIGALRCVGVARASEADGLEPFARRLDPLLVVGGRRCDGRSACRCGRSGVLGAALAGRGPQADGLEPVARGLDPLLVECAPRLLARRDEVLDLHLESRRGCE